MRSEAETEDWREFRAKLIAREKDGSFLGEERNSKTTVENEGWAYETPLIERGAVILGGSENEFGFSLNQQYFHKSVILILEHETQFTKGIILNRPTPFIVEGGWRVWYGGDVCGINGPSNSRDVVCLHLKSGPIADRLSSEIFPPRSGVQGISYTTLEGAREMVKKKAAKVSDFWVFVGYCGWGQNQLQQELDRSSWHLAATDSAVLLGGLAQVRAQAAGCDGIATWADLMKSIGRSVPTSTEPDLNDGMLREWIRVNLSLEKTPASKTVKTTTRLKGRLLRSSCDYFVLKQQFLHKSLVLVLASESDSVSLGVVLNRPSSTRVEFKANKETTRVHLGGDQQSGNIPMILLHRCANLEYESEYVGGGLYQIGLEAADMCMKKGLITPKDLLCISGICAWESRELQRLLDDGGFEDVSENDVPWGDLFNLSELAEEGSLTKSIDVWNKAHEGASATQPIISEREQLADAALKRFAQFFLK